MFPSAASCWPRSTREPAFRCSSTLGRSGRDQLAVLPSLPQSPAGRSDRGTVPRWPGYERAVCRHRYPSPRFLGDGLRAVLAVPFACWKTIRRSFPPTCWPMIGPSTRPMATRSTWKRPTGVARSAGTWGNTSRSFLITAARTWPWFGRVGTGGAEGCSQEGQRSASGGGGEVAEWVWGRGKYETPTQTTGPIDGGFRFRADRS